VSGITTELTADSSHSAGWHSGSHSELILLIYVDCTFSRERLRLV
jgi:hypothetical protein